VTPATNGHSQIFFRDRSTGTNELISRASGVSGTQGDLDSKNETLTPDGRFVVFVSSATDLLGPGVDMNPGGAADDVFLRDRNTNTTELISRATGVSGMQGDGASSSASISADGRFVAFASDASNFDLSDSNLTTDVFVRDRQTNTTTRVSVGPMGVEGNNFSTAPVISADGRFVAFFSLADNLLGPGGDTNGLQDVFVYDRVNQTTERVSVGPGGLEANGASFTGGISADGRYVAFQSTATNLLGPGLDTNGVADIYVHDRQTGVNDLVSVGPGGLQEDAQSFFGGMSADGRWVLFDSQADNLLGAGADGNFNNDVFLRDRVTGTTERVSVGPGGAEADGYSGAGAISADGRIVAFFSLASNLVSPAQPVGSYQQYVRGNDPADPLGIDAALFPNGKLNDIVLESINATSGTVTTLCPADEVAVAAGNAAFLRPESAVGTAACPGGSLNPSLNPTQDVDTSDEVVQYWPGTGAVQNLQCPATAVALSSTRLAALVSECGQSGITTAGCAAGGTDLNGDGDAGDAVVEVHAVGAGAGACALPTSNATWTNVGQAGSSLAVSGDIVAFLTDEAAQGNAQLNADSDATDTVLQVYDAAANQLILGAASTPRARAADEFVLGDRTQTACGDRQLIAFRVNEAAEGAGSLNASADNDTADDVLFVYDAVTRTMQNTGQAAITCPLEACDPRQPYQVSGSVVKFLTFEPDQGGLDLNQDGNPNGIVLQSFDFCAGRTTVIGAVDPASKSNPVAQPDQSSVLVTAAGRCDAGTTCNPSNDLCGSGAFCENDTCNLATGKCNLHTDSTITCSNDAMCQRCILRQPASCVLPPPPATPAPDVCPAGATCKAEAIIAVSGVSDVDDDGVPDAQDNCPTVPNTDQAVAKFASHYVMLLYSTKHFVR